MKYENNQKFNSKMMIRKHSTIRTFYLELRKVIFSTVYCIMCDL